jgi:hypothetical protein
MEYQIMKKTFLASIFVSAAFISAAAFAGDGQKTPIPTAADIAAEAAHASEIRHHPGWYHLASDGVTWYTTEQLDAMDAAAAAKQAQPAPAL